MVRIGTKIFVASLLLLVVVQNPLAEKVKLGTSVKTSPMFYLPIISAQETGFWKENGLDVEWFPFDQPAAFFKGMAARSLFIGLDTSTGAIRSASVGVPVLMVSKIQSAPMFSLFVRAASNIREPKDLRGAKLGVAGFGGPSEAFSRLIADKAGAGKDIKIIAMGGVGPTLAGLRTGVIDGVASPPYLLVKMKYDGVLKELVSASRYLSKEWVEHVVIAHREMVTRDPETVRKIVKGLNKGISYLLERPSWTLQKVMELQGYTEPMAKEVIATIRWSTDGRISEKEVENVRKFVIEYKLAPREVPPANEVFTAEFTQ